MKLATLKDRIFKDKNGNIVIGQTPNLPLIIWLISTVFQQITNGDIKLIFEIVGFGAIFIWSLMEIFQGTNYFRRILGFIVLLTTLYSRFN